MTHELKQIFKAFEAANTKNIPCVLATVVALDGSSYRRPGVRMLLLEDGSSIGAVSGGCVEKEVFKQAESVFTTKIPKVMTYDGRYRLGCEGILYILLEPFNPNETFLTKFWNSIDRREPFTFQSFYEKEHIEGKGFGSLFKTEDGTLSLQLEFKPKDDVLLFEQELNPCSRMIIIGAEHDAVQLCSFASMMGWEVTIVANPKEEKSIINFVGASQFVNAEAETLDIKIDDHTAIVLMTHSYVKDLQFLMRLKDENPGYFGLLGPARRREKLFNELLERYQDISEDFLESIHGPAGLDIGAETPQEIAIAVMGEILAVINKREPQLLKKRVGRIHS
ncbi:XdhC/CoxI family protein [uncultured Croceitalea sp.]|uniref:XdhC family protein n=1 Tax=uncultured Croceitalea sp. TaxID=1798908 RepID=UPI00330593D0